MSYKNTAFVLLGGNIEPRKSFLQEAEEKINLKSGYISNKSAIYETEAWGFESENNFLNILLKVETNYSANELLNSLLEIEMELGRKRNKSQGYSSRTLDADIIYFNNDIINEKDLIIPHPRLQFRKFVLEPLCEIAPYYVHPIFNKTNLKLLDECSDESKVNSI